MTYRRPATQGHSYVPSYVCLVVMVIKLSSSSSSTAASSCPSACDCSPDRPRVINCSNKNLDRVIGHLPQDTAELDLSFNRIANISQSSFASLTELQKLSLENCRLERLERNTFRSLQLLKVLQLSRNRIRFIDDKAFAGLSNLQVLQLSYNELDILPGYIFRGLTLDSLQLDGNRIESIPDEAFLGTKVTSLNLDENRLIRLDRISLRPLEESLTQLSVSRNIRQLTIEDDVFTGFRFMSLSIVSSNLSDVQFLVHVYSESLDISSNAFPRNILFPRSSQLNNSCETLRLADANLLEFSEDLASSLFLVKSIDLSGNRLVNINAGSLFRFTPELITLNLSRNMFVETIFPDDFSSALGRLRTLNLSRAGMTSINPEMFRGADELERVDLSFNHLQVLPENIAQYFDTISTIDLTGNPFHCNCEMLWFRHWLTAAPQPNSVGSVKCATPILFREETSVVINSGVQNDEVISRSETDFICTEPLVRISSNQNLDEGTSFPLSCTSQSDPAADIVWTLNSKESIRITPDKDRTRTLTDAPLQLSRLRAHQTGWYSCSASNLLAETVRYVYIHVVTSSIPPADVTNLAYPEVPAPLKPQRPPLNPVPTFIPSAVFDKTVPTVLEALLSDPVFESTDTVSENITESLVRSSTDLTKLITKVTESTIRSNSVVSHAAATEVLKTSTTTATAGVPAHIPTTRSTTFNTKPTNSSFVSSTAATVIFTISRTLPSSDDVITAVANDANYDTTRAVARDENMRLLWIIIISTLSTLVLVGVVLLILCVYCCRRRSRRQHQYYGDLPAKTVNTRSRRTATGEKRRVFKTPPDLDSLPLNDRLTRCTDVTL